jgi:hypothetical protein
MEDGRSRMEDGDSQSSILNPPSSYLIDPVVLELVFVKLNAEPRLG